MHEYGNYGMIIEDGVGKLLKHDVLNIICDFLTEANESVLE